ncbi:rRNA maturation RNase YbeY [Aminirod propionatiphilus]|uniref:rRNA maturation RNase YbeY n=1 Tax=Aminirod propionatiphilus TaxID=3415223 RepID=A0ACD1DSI1_9BACT|nr:rRNA maturation RNase YbeY [Synergistota bacterium]
MNVELQLEEGDSANPRSPLPEAMEKALKEILPAMIVEVRPELDVKESVEVSLLFVDPAAMADLNGRYRQIGEATDVLSFPQWEDEKGRFLPPDWPLLPLGDVVVCCDVVRREAQARNVPFLSEVLLVIFHGVLHLLGLDHGTAEEEALMWEIQERYRDRVLALVERGA